MDSPQISEQPINRLLATLFFVFALPTLAFIALAAPPGEAPDEPAHLARAGSLLHGQLVGSRRPVLYWEGQRIVNAGVKSNTGPNLVAYGFGYAPGTHEKMTRALHDKLAAIPWSPHIEFIFVPNTASYFPSFYLPASIGLGVAQLVGASPLTAVFAARLAGAATYLALGVLALLLARRGHALLFAALSLPMSLWLGATCNQDGVMLASLCVAAALLTRPGPRGPGYWTAGVLLACVIAVKPVYIALAAAMLLPCRLGDRAQLRAALAGVALAALPGLAWTALAQAVASAVFFLQPSYLPGPLWPGDPSQTFIAPSPGAQAQVFLHAPQLLLTLPFANLLQVAWWRVNEMIGVLGSLNLVLPDPVYAAWHVALCAAIAATCLRPPSDAAERPQPFGTALLLAALVVTVFVIYDAGYLLWTNVGQEVIAGVQGRYFLPLLPMLAIALPAVRFRGAGLVRSALVLPALGLAAAGMVALPLLLVDRYYLN